MDGMGWEGCMKLDKLMDDAWDGKEWDGCIEWDYWMDGMG